jgi:uncharacterized protein (DUF433 family)
LEHQKNGSEKFSSAAKIQKDCSATIINGFSENRLFEIHSADLPFAHFPPSPGLARFQRLGYGPTMTIGHKRDPQAKALQLAEYIEKDPERLGGEPIFRGTRVPVRSLFEHLSAGDSMDLFLEDFPGVTRDQVQTVLELAGIGLLEEAQDA